MPNIIDGRALAKGYRTEIKAYSDKLISQNMRTPCLATILVGNDGGSAAYMKNQTKLCNKLGIESKEIIFNEDIKQEELVDTIHKLNNNKDIDGIIIQLPLPSHINEKEITSKISFKKDVDGLTDINTGRLYKGEKCFIPCTPKAVIEILKSINIPIKGKNAVVIGRSNIVGKPVSQLLLNENATVTICHSKTVNLKEICRNADILIAAVGKPKLVKGDFIKKGAVVIDVGTNSVDGKLIGDVDFEEAVKAIGEDGYITPVPGGVGSMTTTMLIKNTCEAFRNNVY